MRAGWEGVGNEGMTYEREKRKRGEQEEYEKRRIKEGKRGLKRTE